MADLLLRAARLASGGPPEDVHVRDGVVAAITGAGRQGPGTLTGAPAHEVDLAGRWLLPGLWDEHVHFTQWALVRQRLDVSAATSAAGAAALARSTWAGTRSAGTAAAPGTVLVGQGFRDALWPDTPTTAMLDAACPGLPVAILSADLHSVWLSTPAAHHLGVDVVPTGLLREGAAFAVATRLADLPVTLTDAWAHDAAVEAAARGVVGVVDLEMAWNIDTWTRRVAAGTRSLRVDVGIYPDHLDRAERDGLRTGRPVPGGGGLLTVGPLKLFTDGSLNTRTAFCHHAYPDGSSGELVIEPDELDELLARARACGLTPAVHAIGDRAVTAALDAFERVGTGGRIEHAQLLRDQDLPRFAELGVTASVQPEHAMDDRDAADHHWSGHTARSFAYRSLLDAGAHLALGSDAPVAPLDPWEAIAAAVSRSRDHRDAWHPEQRIDAAAALAASTRGRAHVQVGDPADLVAVDTDPWSSDGAALRLMAPQLTLLAGRPTHVATHLQDLTGVRPS